MANRPRGPQEGRKNETAGPDRPVADDVVMPASSTDTITADAPLVDGPLKDEPSMAPVSPDVPSTASASEPAAAADARETTLPPPENQPPLPGAERADDMRTQAGESDGTAAFAQSEGLSPGARRDLGEFEDDEVVIAAAEPAETAEPYRDPHEEHGAVAAAVPFGSLLGAGLVGGLIAAAIGAGLLYSGIVAPATQSANTEQSASAAELQTVQGEVRTLSEAVEQIRSAQAAGGATSGTVSTSDFTILSDRVAGIERNAQASASGGAETAAALAAAGTSVDEVRSLAQDAGGAAAEARSLAESAGTAAQGASAAAEEAQASAEATGRTVEELQTRVATVEEANRQATIAFAAANLRSAVETGGPFSAELDNLAAAGGDVAAIEPLRSFATDGVPTLPELVAGWTEAEAAMIAAARAPEAGGNIGAQVMSGLGSLVTVRPTAGAPASEEGPEAGLSRMRAALIEGDLAGWSTEYEALPEAVQTAGAEFAAEVTARQDALAIVDDALSGATPASQEG